MTKIIADLHLHSRFSRAVSQQMEPETMAAWAQKKGIDLLGTADFTHPLWRRQLKSVLDETTPGIYQLQSSPTKFIISGEIASIYTQNGHQYRIHNLVIVPNFTVAEKIVAELEKNNANLESDGRPIIGLSSSQLAELVFSADKNCLLVPCHVWTPWFSLYGSRSGFDSIEECFGKFSSQIFAVETGLSSDPAMNWQIEELVDRQIVSFSDAHSPAKIGREATIMKARDDQEESLFSYQDLVKSLKGLPGAKWEISGTIEFYPEEGKYHFDGHRACQIRRSPEETRQKGGLCPVCGKPLTLGVLYRVQQLAKRNIFPLKKEIGGVNFQFDPQGNHPPFITLVPLLEIIAEAQSSTVNSEAVKDFYEEMINRLGNEFSILTEMPIEKITSLFGPKIGEGIDKVRKGKIAIEPGFDGVFGTVKIWGDKEKPQKETQISLF